MTFFLPILSNILKCIYLYLSCLMQQARAVLQYKAKGKILDMRVISVPYRYRGRGIARLLTEVKFIFKFRITLPKRTTVHVNYALSYILIQLNTDNVSIFRQHLHMSS